MGQFCEQLLKDGAALLLISEFSSEAQKYQI